MIATLSSEWIKLRTIRVHWVLAALAVLFPLVVATLVALFTGELALIGPEDLSNLLAGTGVISAMLLGAVAAISLTAEFSHGTIRPTYAATPARHRVILAKLLVSTAVTVTVMVAMIVLAWASAAAILSSRGADLGLPGDDGSSTVLLSLVIVAVLLTWFATALGLLIRNAPATVSLFLLWPLVAEGILAVTFALIGNEGWIRWLPYQAAFGTLTSSPDPDGLGRPGGWLWFGALSLGLLSLGMVIDRRRDA
jgi:ABC-2 type transport system permease protein